MLGSKINDYIRSRVNFFLSNKQSNSHIQSSNSEDFSSLIDSLILVHIKYWQFEDKIGIMNDPLTIGQLKMETDSLFKRDRPGILKKLDILILKVLSNSMINETKEGLPFKKYIDETISINQQEPVQYDNIYSDTFSELMDKIAIVHIRRWHLIERLETSSNKSTIKEKVDSLDNDKLPMLSKSTDKLVLKMLSKEILYSPSNTKQYKGVH